MQQTRLVSYLGIVLLLTGTTISAAKDDRECEVCIAVLTEAIDGLPSEHKDKQDKIAEKIREVCGGKKDKDNKFCFYIGALPESATSIMNEVSKPLSWQMPPQKVCEKLKSKDQQICELKYDKKIDWKNIDLDKMRVKELKNILSGWGEVCKACTEKTEFVNRIKELMPKYVPKSEL